MNERITGVLIRFCGFTVIEKLCNLPFLIILMWHFTSSRSFLNAVNSSSQFLWAIFGGSILLSQLFEPVFTMFPRKKKEKVAPFQGWLTVTTAFYYSERTSVSRWASGISTRTQNFLLRCEEWSCPCGLFWHKHQNLCSHPLRGE